MNNIETGKRADWLRPRTFIVLGLAALAGSIAHGPINKVVGGQEAIAQSGTQIETERIRSQIAGSLSIRGEVLALDFSGDEDSLTDVAITCLGPDLLTETVVHYNAGASASLSPSHAACKGRTGISLPAASYFTRPRR